MDGFTAFPKSPISGTCSAQLRLRFLSRSPRAMSTLFVADLHLDAALPAAITQFQGLLRGPARDADALYILGDLFESWVGDDDDNPARAEVCAALQELSLAGVACYVCHGNRDFLLAEGFEARTGCRIMSDPSVVELYGERVLLTHGDALCTADTAYQSLRSVVRTGAWQRRFLRLPLATRRLLADAARAGSRAHTGLVAPAIMDASEVAVQATLRASGVRTLIHGHTHRPGIHDYLLDGAPARRIVLGAWYEQGSCLVWDHTGYELQVLTRSGPE